MIRITNYKVTYPFSCLITCGQMAKKRNIYNSTRTMATKLDTIMPYEKGHHSQWSYNATVTWQIEKPSICIFVSSSLLLNLTKWWYSWYWTTINKFIWIFGHVIIWNFMANKNRYVSIKLVLWIESLTGWWKNIIQKIT